MDANNKKFVIKNNEKIESEERILEDDLKKDISFKNKTKEKSMNQNIEKNHDSFNINKKEKKSNSVFIQIIGILLIIGIFISVLLL